MSIEDPDLVRRSRKAARRRAQTDDLMRQLAKLDAVWAKAAALQKTAAMKERRLRRALADMPIPERPN